MLGVLRVGDDAVALHVEARGRKNGRPSDVALALHGYNEASLTARVASEAMSLEQLHLVRELRLEVRLQESDVAITPHPWLYLPEKSSRPKSDSQLPFLA
jgi:hypothetical protein